MGWDRGYSYLRPVQRSKAREHFTDENEETMLVKTEPALLYFGTPVVLISTVNEDGYPQARA